ncbi:hypothetical protein PO319_24290, partial [Escherichia coli]
VSIKNDGHYFCRAGGNRPDGLNEPVTLLHTHGKQVCTKNYQFLLYISYFSGLSRICIRTE